MFPHLTLLSNYLNMKTKYITFCKRCNTETEHYANSHCVPCKLAYNKAHYKKNQAKALAHRKAYYQEHRAETLAYMKVYQQEHQAERSVYQMSDVNNNGIPKHSIRGQSNYILFQKRKHTKLDNYEIHHCFGYGDPSKFIYIPKTLHLQIHQRLRNKGISAEDEHYEQIKDLINECKEYTYISI